MTIADADYRSAQAVFWGQAGTWAFERFSEINRQYFTNQIPYRGVACG